MQLVEGNGVVFYDIFEIPHRRLGVIAADQPEIRRDLRLRWQHIARGASLHLGKGDGGAHQGVQLAALLFAQVIQIPPNSHRLAKIMR